MADHSTSRMFKITYRDIRDRCGNLCLRWDAVSAAGFVRTSRFDQLRGGRDAGRATMHGLKLLVVSMLVTLSVLLGGTHTHNTADATSTPMLGSTILSVFAPTTHAVYDGAANPLAATGGRSDTARTDAVAVAMGFTGVPPPSRLDDHSGPGRPVAGVARMIAEAFAAGAGFAGSGVHGSSVSSGGSSGLAILPALGTLPDRQLSHSICTDYLCRFAWVFSRPVVRPG